MGGVPDAGRGALVAALALALIASTTSNALSRPSGPSPAGPLQAGWQDFDLVDTWTDHRWELTPGHIGTLEDVTSDARGNVYVLDSRTNAQYIHVYGPDLVPLRVFRLPSADRRWAVDAAPDGTLYTYFHTGTSSAFVGQIERLDDQGVRQAIGSVTLERDEYYSDIAATPDGRVLLLRTTNARGEEAPTNSIDVLDGDLRLVQRVLTDSFYHVDHTVPGHFHLKLWRLDVGSDGRLFVSSEAMACT